MAGTARTPGPWLAASRARCAGRSLPRADQEIHRFAVITAGRALPRTAGGYPLEER